MLVRLAQNPPVQRPLQHWLLAVHDWAVGLSIRHGGGEQTPPEQLPLQHSPFPPQERPSALHGGGGAVWQVPPGPQYVLQHSTPLVHDPKLSVSDYTLGYIERLRKDVAARIERMG